VARQVTYLVIAPYLGVRVAAREAAAAAREIDRRLRMASAEHAPPDELDGLALTDLQRRCLAYVATHPGCSSTRIAGAMGVRHVAQASRLMRILREANLATARPRGTAYEWTVTPLGEAALQVLERPAEPAWLARAAALSGTARCRRT
jgi:DNA-binding MarR family transcriptional regulator